MNLLALEPALLCGRTVLVNPRRDLKRKDMEITYENIDNLKRKYNLLNIHGNIEVNFFLNIFTYMDAILNAKCICFRII